MSLEEGHHAENTAIFSQKPSKIENYGNLVLKIMGIFILESLHWGRVRRNKHNFALIAFEDRPTLGHNM